ncbi:MAG: putative Ig domain-containing protein [Candidatus Omnitrophica bacterium]|nr:putative Ig domain-containing protein [Candidatus Omnitrophota bacterium]
MNKTQVNTNVIARRSAEGRADEAIQKRLLRSSLRDSLAMTFFICVIIITISGYVFASTEISLTATARILPFGVYAPVITANDQTLREGATLEFEVLATDANTQDSVHLEIIQGQPSWLTIISNTDGNPASMRLKALPPVGSIGRYRISFKATDNSPDHLDATKDIYIIVNSGIGNPPVLDVIRDKEIPIRVKLEFTINATDPDGDPLIYSASGQPFNMGAIFDPSARKFTWIPANNQAGTYPVHFEVSDGALTDSQDIIIYVIAADAPVFDPFPYLSHPLFLNMYTAGLRVGTALSFAVNARDPNEDPIIYGALHLPSGAAFSASNQTFRWTPGPDQAGNYIVTFTASDGVNLTTKDLEIVVQSATGPQLKPVGERYAKTGQTLSFTLEAVDPDTPQNQLTYSVSNNPPGSSLVGPNFTWTPNASQVGIYRDVIFRVTDGISSDSTNCWIFVTPGGTPVIERIGEKHIVELRTLIFTVHATDPDGDPLTYLPPENAPKGSFFDTATHTFTWTPAIGERGVYRDIIFSVTDGVNTATDNVWIFVDGNDAPIVQPIPEQHIIAGHKLSFAISAYDPNGDTLTYTCLNLPLGATFQGNTFEWTPDLEQVGVYNDILFNVSDGLSIETVRTWIFVEAPGAPVMDRVGEKYVTAGQYLTFMVTATDPDGDPLTYSAENLPSGSLFDPQTRTFSWTPTFDQVGVYPRVLFHVTDGRYTDTEDCWIFVEDAAGSPLTGNTTLKGMSTAQVSANEENNYVDTWTFVLSFDAPEFLQDTKIVYGKVGELLEFTIPPAKDPDNKEEELTYYGVNLPQGATFVNRTFRWLPQPGQEGIYKNCRLEVKDLDGNTDSDVFWISVEK